MRLIGSIIFGIAYVIYTQAVPHDIEYTGAGFLMLWGLALIISGKLD